MKIIGISGNKGLIVEMSESEIMKVSGVAGKPVISGRFKPGRDVNISPIYDKVEKINTKNAELKTALAAIKTAASDMENSLILE